MQDLSSHGIELVYLASWRDPFGDPDTYARQVFSAWELGNGDVLIVFLREGGRWRVAGVVGPGVGIDREGFRRALSSAESLVRHAPPAHAVLALVKDLLAMAEGSGVKEEGHPLWPYLVAGLAALVGGVWVARTRLCPRCLRPLRRERSWRGIIWVCPRCRYTRVPRRGRGTGSRRGIYP